MEDGRRQNHMQNEDKKNIKKQKQREKHTIVVI